MPLPHPQAEAAYRVIPLEGETFGIEIITPEAEPGVVKSFSCAADAETWITAQKERVASWSGRRVRFRDHPAGQ